MSDILAVQYDDLVNPTLTGGGGPTADSAGPYAGFYVQVGGQMRVITARGTNIILQNLIAGIIYPIAIKNFVTDGGNTATVLGLRSATPPYSTANQ